MTNEELKNYIIDKLEDLKVEEIIYIDTSKTSSLSDNVIIGNGRSGKHIESSIESLKTELKNEYGITGLIGGKANDGWVIFDLGNTIVHLFVAAVRDIYNLEELINVRNKNISEN